MKRFQRAALIMIGATVLPWVIAAQGNIRPTWQNPFPQGNSLNDVQAVSPSIAYAVGDHGTILKSTSGGLKWDILSPLNTVQLTRLQFLNESLGWIMGGGS